MLVYFLPYSDRMTSTVGREMGLPQSSEKVKSLLSPFDQGSSVDSPLKVLTNVDAQELKTGHSLHLLFL